MTANRRPREYSDETLIEAINSARGRVTHAATALGCDPKTFYRRAEICPELQEAWDKARERATDDAEDVVQRSFYCEDPRVALSAAQWWLSRMGRGRGFGDSQEVTVKGSTRIVLDFVTVDKNENGELVEVE